MKKDVNSTDEYIARVEPAKKACFNALYDLIYEVAPGVQLSYKYDMLHFQIEEKWIAMADQKHFVGLYVSQKAIAKHQEEMGNLNCGKSCVRLKPNKPLPKEILSVLIKESLGTSNN